MFGLPMAYAAIAGSKALVDLAMTLLPTDEALKKMDHDAEALAGCEIVGRDKTGLVVGLRRKSDGTMELAGNFRQSSVDKKRFLREFKRRYAYHLLRQELDSRGYVVVGEKTGADRTIELTARKWA